MGNLWTVFCGESNSSYGGEILRVADLIFLAHPSSCANHLLILCFDILLLIVNLFTIVFKKSLTSSNVTAPACRLSSLQIVSAIFNGSLGLVYLSFGIWILEENLRKTRDIAPLHSWTTFMFHGLIWSLIGLTVNLRGTSFQRASLRLLTFLTFLFSGITCGISLYIATLRKERWIKNFLNVLSFIGSFLLLLCTFKGHMHEGCDDNDIHYPLLSSSNDDSRLNPFTKASVWSRLTFWWLNPLMKRGTEKTLSDEDMPSLHVSDRAESCYLSYSEILNRRKQSDRIEESEILKTILLCHWREIIISGFFALLKVMTVSAGPLLLKALVKVAEGNESFKYERYILVAVLFLTKILESMSQRQWYFRSRLVGLRVRSLLTAVIYQKQLRLSNSAKLNQSSGQIMNYVTVDSYRIGEFPFWLHQIWTTSLQLCLAVLILFQAVGLATLASLAVIILTVLCNSPIGKLQYKFQSKLREAQDERLKKMSEAILNMKVLKLSAWETHFRQVIEKLRGIEEKCLWSVQLCQANYIVIFWSSSFLVSSATFATCYFLGVPLSSTNVFTFVATLQLVQEPVRLIPDVIAVFIQAKVAFSRIAEFLGEPELETASVRVKCSLSDTRVSFQSADLSWDENPSRLTLRNISLGLKHGDKIAVCGEVGSGKSTLLAAILGEVPIMAGTEYILGALSTKTVVLVTHQVDFLRTFDYVLFMSDGKILHAAPYPQLLATSREFRDLVNAHKATVGSDMLSEVTSSRNRGSSSGEIRKKYAEMEIKTSENEYQLIKKEEREVGDSGLKPYILYLNQNKGFFFFSVAALSHLMSLVGQIMQNIWMAANVDDRNVTTLRLIVVYLLIGLVSSLFIICRSISTVVLNMKMSRALFSQLLMALCHAPMSFYDSTPLGRILSRVSSDLSVADLDVPFSLLSATAMTSNCYSYMVVLAVITWQVLLVMIPMIFIVMWLQRYYFSSARELMRINGTTKSLVANHLAESMAGVITIRAFEEEDRFFAKNLQLIDTNGSPYFHYFSANEWLIQRLEILCATVLSFAALCMVSLPTGTLSSGFIGMSLSYGLALNSILTFSINTQCLLSNYIVSVERLDQYMQIPSEALEVREENRPPVNWPTLGKVEIQDLKIRYRHNSPLVLRGISCVFEGGHKVGIVGRTGSGKTTLISALFRLVEPAGGKILVDGVDISQIGLHELRSRLGIIPQDPTLFNGTVGYNLDPLGEHTEQELWEVLGKCQLKEAIREKKNGLDSLVVEDGSNWSMGQRQLFSLGRALLRRSKILVLDEATASIDNATDMILQKIIRTEFADCTVITVAHRIPTVMDCNMVLAISEGKLVEYDEPVNLMKREDTLFGQLVKEYWSHQDSAE